jgi:hypothetical protein
LTKRIAERVLDAEMDTHLGYAKHAPQGKNTGNYRNGKSAKTVRSVHGDIELEVPRDRNSTFEPQRAGGSCRVLITALSPSKLAACPPAISRLTLPKSMV